MNPREMLQEALRLHQAGRLAEAESRYRLLLAQLPQHAEALLYIGLLAYQKGRPEEAVRLIGDSIAINGDDPAAHSNLGNALASLGRHAEAETAFSRALQLDPRQADAWFNLGNVQRLRERYDDADASYRRAVALQPNHVGALSNLANLLLVRRQPAAAGAAFDNLGDALQAVGRTEDAAGAYRQALAVSPQPGVEAKLAFLTPVIPMSVEEIERTRERLFAATAALAAKGLRIDDPLRYASNAIFYTGYHGRNDRDLRTAFADFYLRASPALAWCAPHCTSYAGAGGRIRVGFISRYFLPEHPMTKLYGGIIEHLDRRQFDVTVFRFDRPAAATLYADTKVTVLGTDLAAARQAIAQARLDVLFYTDIGMDPATYFLAFSRLAPVQCVTFGHPVTTGVATIDYFLSARELEPAGAQDHYTETLVPLSVVPTYFRQPSPAASPPTRADFGLPADARLYLCAQNLIKFHPEFDAVLAGILRRDPKGRLVLIRSKDSLLAQRLLERLRRSLPDAADRVTFLPFLKLDALLGFARSVDAVLDTPVFGGGTTSLETFAVDAPVLTWPGPFARSRITHALYRQMGIEGLAVQDAAQYVDQALRLANDPSRRLYLQEEVRQKKHVLYENAALVREIERFLAAAVEAAALRRRVQGWGENEAAGAVKAL